MLRILADRQLAQVDQAFSSLGDVTLFDADSLGPETVRESDVLLVRSVTQVDAELLAGSSVRFVGTATSGTDHVDTAYLEQEGIGFAHAGGSNAEAVVDYCLAAMASLYKPDTISTISVGIVGYGFVGSALVRRLEAAGVTVRVCDPPLAESGFQRQFLPLEALSSCDLVSLHVPLTSSGSYPTLNLIDSSFLSTMKENSVLLNSCRAGVVDEAALLGQSKRLRYVADVWLGEPNPNPHLVSLSILATPHIAGYSRRAKVSATLMLSSELAEFLVAPEPPQWMPPSEVILECNNNCIDPWSVTTAALPLAQLSSRFKLAVAAGQGAREFKKIREELLARREFCELRPQKASLTAADLHQLKALGFLVS